MLVGTTLAAVHNNTVFALAACEMKGIVVSARSGWTTLSAPGQSQLAKISGNIVSGMSNGIEVLSILDTITENTITDPTGYGLLYRPYLGGIVSSNIITNAPVGLAVERAGTLGTGTVTLSQNILSKCDIGFAPTYATATLDIMTHNIVRDCATGAVNLKTGYFRVDSDYYENNTNNLDAVSTLHLGAASMSQTLGLLGGTLYGNPASGF
jgi:hypothetical protein